MTQHPIIVFTDLDGCLLDHNNYDFSQARPLLSFLKTNKIPLIINSSKTKPEIERIQKDIGISLPFIIENGAAIIFPEGADNDWFNIDYTTLAQIDNCRMKQFARPRSELLLITSEIKKKHQFKFKGFNDMSVSQISGLTQLSEHNAFEASQRLFSEPLLWQDSQPGLAQFKQYLGEHAISLQQGGRFIHLSGEYSKGQAMQWLLEHWQYNNSTHSVIALGDSMNDVSMLNLSDYAIVIKNTGSRLSVTGKKQTIHSSFPGTAGWVEALTPLINQLIKA